MNFKKIYIILFIILYAFVAIVSGIHGFAFFGLANVPLLAIMLAVAFEMGQAAVLFSILTDASQRKKIMPWILMIILTIVQVMGNVFNSYRYLILNAGEDLRFFKEPIFIWTDIPDAQANVILSFIQGAILPIVALLLTSMVAGFLNKKEDETVEYEYEEEPVGETEEVVEETPQEEPTQEEELILEDEASEDENNDIPENVISEPVDEPENERQENYKEEFESSPEVKLDTVMEVSEDDRKPEVKGQSHFVHI